MNENCSAALDSSDPTESAENFVIKLNHYISKGANLICYTSNVGNPNHGLKQRLLVQWKKEISSEK